MNGESENLTVMSPSLPTSPAREVPAGMTDTHVHVFDPSHFAYAGNRRYTPPPATCAQLDRVMARLGTDRVVVVQPSCYGNDNEAMLDALVQLGPARARGIAVIDETTLDDCLDHIEQLHRSGVRGVRLNASVNDLGDHHAMTAHLARLQSATAHLGWHVQMYMPVATVMVMADALTALTMPVVLDHFGGLDAATLSPTSPEVNTLLRLLRTGRVYIKLSAPYRVVGSSTEHRSVVTQALGDVVQRFAQTAPDRLLWGSDWPHTGGAGRRKDSGIDANDDIEPFRPENAASALDDLHIWLPNAEVLHRVLVRNPERLYGFAQEGPPTHPTVAT